MSISDEAVEAAAKAHFEMSTNQYMPWEQIDGGYRNATYVFPIRAALEAAAPHMLRSVTDEAFGYAVSAIRGHGEFTTAEAEAAVQDVINALGMPE